MRSVCLWLIALLALGPAPLLAQARVLSGEHDGFTRLVTPIKPGTPWHLEKATGHFTLRAESPKGGFDLSGIFRLIRRDRIREVSATTDGLIFELGCDCDVVSSLVQGRFVVIDVVTSAAHEPPPAPAESKARLVENTVRPTADPPARHRVLPVITENQKAPSVLPLDLPMRAREPLSTTEEELLNQVQRQLAEGMGRAATRGLIEPQPGAALPRLPKPPVDHATFAPELLDDDAAQGAKPATAVHNNLRITSSIDRPLGHEPDSPPQSLTGQVCPSSEELNLDGWSDGRNLLSQIGAARRRLFLEFDKLDQDAALRLAQLYLHFGFGAEALQILKLDSELMAREPLLADIARIMEHDRAPETSILPDLMDCDTDAALWAILARPDLGVAHHVDPRAALRALNKLPMHLRRFIAPALSRRLLSHGDSDAAATALRSVERATDDPPPGVKLAQAEIAIDEGKVEEGTDSLEEVIALNTEQSPEALIALVDTRLEANLPLELETAGLIEAYAKELQDDDLGPELRRVHVLALARSGQFDAAADALSALGGNADTEAATRLRLQFIRELTAGAADVVFLDHAFQVSSRDIGRLASRPRQAFARRLLDLGFPAQAQAAIATLPDRPINSLRQSLAARISLALSQPRAALAALGELTGEEADLLRAEAYRMAGEFDAAHRLFSQAGQTEEAQRAAWLANDPASLPISDDPLFGPVLALADTPAEPVSEIVDMITDSAAALQESEEARRKLTALLAAPEISVAEGTE